MTDLVVTGRSCLLSILYTTLRSYIFLSSLVRFSRKMRKLTLQFIYILCIYNIAVYTLIRTSLLAFIAYNQTKFGERERARKRVQMRGRMKREKEARRKRRKDNRVSIPRNIYVCIFERATSPVIRCTTRYDTIRRHTTICAYLNSNDA